MSKLPDWIADRHLSTEAQALCDLLEIHSVEDVLKYKTWEHFRSEAGSHYPAAAQLYELAEYYQFTRTQHLCERLSDYSDFKPLLCTILQHHEDFRDFMCSGGVVSSSSILYPTPEAFIDALFESPMSIFNLADEVSIENCSSYWSYNFNLLDYITDDLNKISNALWHEPTSRELNFRYVWKKCTSYLKLVRIDLEERLIQPCCPAMCKRFEEGFELIKKTCSLPVRELIDDLQITYSNIFYSTALMKKFLIGPLEPTQGVAALIGDCMYSNAVLTEFFLRYNFFTFLCKSMQDEDESLIQKAAVYKYPSCVLRVMEMSYYVGEKGVQIDVEDQQLPLMDLFLDYFSWFSTEEMKFVINTYFYGCKRGLYEVDWLANQMGVKYLFGPINILNTDDLFWEFSDNENLYDDLCTTKNIKREDSPKGHFLHLETKFDYLVKFLCKHYFNAYVLSFRDASLVIRDFSDLSFNYVQLQETLNRIDEELVDVDKYHRVTIQLSNYSNDPVDVETQESYQLLQHHVRNLFSSQKIYSVIVKI